MVIPVNHGLLFASVDVSLCALCGFLLGRKTVLVSTLGRLSVDLEDLS